MNHELVDFRFFITGISTDVGKTVVSAIVAEALQASYWKPIQAGDLDNSDSIKLKNLTKNVCVLPEAYRLTTPQSPHAAARVDQVDIPAKIDLPRVEGSLIVEGAGGLLVPINDTGTTIADLAKQWALPVIIVSRHYLGSINHTLLTIEVLKSRKMDIAGIIFVGDENRETEQIIARTGVPVFGRIPIAAELTTSFVSEQARNIKLEIERIFKK